MRHSKVNARKWDLNPEPSVSASAAADTFIGSRLVRYLSRLYRIRVHKERAKEVHSYRMGLC